MAYTITGIDPSEFQHLFGLSDEQLAEHGVVRRPIKEGDTIPERVELREAPAGSDVLLVNYTHQPARNPYHASHAIFVREHSTEAAVVHDLVPEVLQKRLISLRAFDNRDFLAAANVVPGTELESLIVDYLARPEVSYLHAHYAGPGCFAALIERN